MDYRTKWLAFVEWCRAHPEVVKLAAAFVAGFVLAKLV